MRARHREPGGAGGARAPGAQAEGRGGPHRSRRPPPCRTARASPARKFAPRGECGSSAPRFRQPFKERAPGSPPHTPAPPPPEAGTRHPSTPAPLAAPAPTAPGCHPLREDSPPTPSPVRAPARHPCTPKTWRRPLLTPTGRGSGNPASRRTPRKVQQSSGTLRGALHPPGASLEPPPAGPLLRAAFTRGICPPVACSFAHSCHKRAEDGN